ncbi:MAG: M56 family metallopeptidase [bacterium]|nr:M56 family metallopeptidase [bacterium]
MIAFLNQIAEAWWGWIGPMLWQVSLLILLIGAIDLVIGRWAWPQVRYALWLLILVKLLIPPSWSLPTSLVSRSRPWAREQIVRLWELEPGLSEEGRPAERPAIPSAAGGASPAAPSSLPQRQGAPARAAGPPSLVWQAYVMGTWILGMGLFIVLLALRIAKLRRWHRQQVERQTIPPWFHELMVGTARRLRLERLPAIVFSDEAVTPAVYGVFRPVLLLPAHYTDSLSREEAEHVLLHELAHLKRGDLWLNGLCLLLQIVYWLNPLLIWVHRQMKHVRELCCDLTVANLLREKTERYRRTLLDTARELLSESPEPGMGLLGVFEEPFRLVARLRWLEKESWRGRRWMRATSWLVTLVVVSLFLPMGTVATEPASRAGEAGWLMTYRMPESGALRYHLSAVSTRQMGMRGELVEWGSTQTIEFSLRSLGFEQANHRIEITIDSMAVSVDVPQLDLIPDTSEVPGKRFEMVLSPLGQELELSGADAIQYDMGPDGKHNIAPDFQILFPDLAGRPVRVGDSWTTKGTITEKRERGDAVMHLESLNTLAAIETVDGRPCARVVGAVSGTLEGKSQVERTELVIISEIEGIETWTFAYEDGQLVRREVNLHAWGRVAASGPQSMTVPMTQEIKIETRLLR